MTEADIRHVLGLLGMDDPVRGAHGWLLTTCPLAPETHARGTDRRPSFRIHVNTEGRSGYYCFSCKEKGALIDLPDQVGYINGEDLRHIAAVAAGLEVVKEFGEYDDEPDLSTIRGMTELDPQIYLAMYPLAWEYARTREYLIRRGVSQMTAALMDLRADPDLQTVMFPIFATGRRLFGFQGRYVYDRVKNKTHNYNHFTKSRVLLGEHLMRPGYPKAVVEGPFAYAHLIEVGAREFCDPCATLGSDMSDTQAGKLIEKGDPVVLMYDDDPAGTLGLYGKFNEETGLYENDAAWAKLSGETRVHVPDYPPRCADPDDLTCDEIYNMIFPP